MTRAYYPRLKDDLMQFALDFVVNSADDLSNLDFLALMDVIDFDLLSLTGICVESCPVTYDVICTSDYLSTNARPSPSEVALCQEGELVTDFENLLQIPRTQFWHDNEYCQNCYNVLMNTTEVFFRCFDIITTVNTFDEVCTYPDMTNRSQYFPNGTLDETYVDAYDTACLTKRVADEYVANKPTYESNPLAELMGSTMATLQSWAKDTENSALVIVSVGIGGAMVCGFIWIAFLRLCTGCIVWGTIVGFIFFLACGASYCWLMSGYFDAAAVATWVAEAAASIGLDALAANLERWVNSTDFSNQNMSSSNFQVVADLGIDVETDTQTLWRVGAFSATIVWTVVVILVIVVAKKIKIAIAIIEEASMAIMRMPCLVFFPFLTAVFILLNALFLIFSVALMASAENITIGEITTSFQNYTNTDCAVVNSSDAFNATDVFVDPLDYGTALSQRLLCLGIDFLAEWAHIGVIDILNWYQLFCFFWNNAVLQGIGIMVVAGAVADWYWTRPSFDKSVKESEWMSHLEGARSFHGIPEGVFVQRGGRWDLVLCVNKLALTDKHVVKYDKNDSAHRQLLAMRGYDPEPFEMDVDDDKTCHGVGTYVRFNMENLRAWKTGLRQGIEEDGEDPRAFYSEFDQKYKPCSRLPQKMEFGLKACLKHGKVSSPAWGEVDAQGVPVWKKESKRYYEKVQDTRGYYGPVDVNFGKIITTPDHQRLNNAYVHQMMLAGKLRKGGNGKDFRWPFCGSLYRTLRFHLGSVCVGAFIIALVQIIRAIFAYIDRHTKSWQNKNKCYALMFKAIHVILCCLERCLKYITKNAYIMVAMRGKPFCESCCVSFKLLLTNLVQFVIVGIFSKVVVMFGKVFIVVVCCFATYGCVKVIGVYTDPTSLTYVTNSFIPVTLTGLLAFGVASAFLHVYDLAIATILLCFCEDYKFHNVGEPSKVMDHDEVYMPSSLRNIVLDAESRKHLPHPMTYEEVRVYSATVHNIAGLPEEPEVHPCQASRSRTNLAKVTPATNVTTVTKFEEGGATKQEPPKQQATAKSDKEPAVGNSEII
eukprot:CAMPEP_0195527514 /NCGR_PEP_ID=MMETSP0794_2-20130614/29231_1 /TAXON_ID=515487 /ORGANISM="Stephanopyxis turris, Strain CCMP 815" /LENGTH=1048 /DNA_ID=CAMNT_0040658435 /DNA_START=444 /DNA_END=3590 /DNA_ORIENTATION=+